ncbi:NRDE family protein [Halomonas aquamarina]|uniref:NRDE family protein n=1 Tax=Vreelandella aquamarina TaxID=77097 RepID=A0ACC5VQC1_9GAMM|nr:NRDE family protein [Halomonas aquamarina]MBZ5486421.1 NRDE family protein [Halomonas aquamarina]
MCLLAFAWQPDTAMPLRLAGNRDERHDRPTQALHYWKDNPSVLGGRDLEAGGSWLAAARGGRVAALTNVRDPTILTPANAPSRGELVAKALDCDDIDDWLGELAEHRAQRYAGFNLLVATPRRIWHLHRGNEHVALTNPSPGVHGLSNANLNTPWPKLKAVREALATSTLNSWRQATGQVLNDHYQAPDSQLPDTGVGLILERQLSAAFILGETYGTRATTWLTLDRQGQATITEKRFGPWGRFEGETTLDI